MLLYTLCKILKRNKIQCPDIGMCVGELPSVNDTLFSWPKRSHLIIKLPLFRAGFAIPEGAPLSSNRCTTCNLKTCLKIFMVIQKLLLLVYCKICWLFVGGIDFALQLIKSLLLSNH